MSAPADHIRALVCHFPRRIRETRLLLMLRAYIDDSKHTPETGVASGVYILAGYIGQAEKWAEFADDWDAALKGGTRSLDYLKTFQAYRLDDPNSMFYRWAPQERDDKLLSLAKTVNRHAWCSIQTGVRPEEYRETMGLLTGEQVYNFLFYSIIAELAKMLDKQGIKDKIEIYFDEQGDVSKKRLRQGFQFFMDHGPAELRDKVAGEPEFKNDMDISPLQAADLMAWHFRRNIFDHDRKRPLNNPVFDELLNLRRVTGLWDQRKLKTMMREKMGKIIAPDSGRPMTLPDPSSGWGAPWTQLP